MADNYKVQVYCTNGNWFAAITFEGQHAQIVPLVPQFNSVWELVGRGGTLHPIIIRAEHPCPPNDGDPPEDEDELKKHKGVFESAGCNEEVFAFGGLPVCVGPEPGTPGPCHNLLRLRVKWACCDKIPGWDGEGWYCILSDSETDVLCEPVELLDVDSCDSGITICSGPYEDEATALENCGFFGDFRPYYTCCDAAAQDPEDMPQIGDTISGMIPIQCGTYGCGIPWIYFVIPVTAGRQFYLEILQPNISETPFPLGWTRIGIYTMDSECRVITDDTSTNTLASMFGWPCCSMVPQGCYNFSQETVDGTNEVAFLCISVGRGDILYGGDGVDGRFIPYSFRIVEGTCP